MILVLNATAGINLSELADFLIKKIVDIRIDGYKLLFTPDNSSYHLYKTKGFKILRDNADGEYFATDNEAKRNNISNIITNLYKNTYNVAFQNGGAGIYIDMYNSDTKKQRQEEEFNTLINTYNNRIFDNFLIYGCMSPEFIHKIEGYFGKGQIQVLNLVRNPSKAYSVYDVHTFFRNFDQEYDDFSEEELSPNVPNIQNQLEKFKFTHFVETYINALNLQNKGYVLTKIEDLVSSKINIFGKTVNLGVYFKTDENGNLKSDVIVNNELTSFNDYFMHLRYNHKYYDVFSLLDYKPL